MICADSAVLTHQHCIGVNSYQGEADHSLAAFGQHSHADQTSTAHGYHGKANQPFEFFDPLRSKRSVAIIAFQVLQMAHALLVTVKPIKSTIVSWRLEPATVFLVVILMPLTHADATAAAATAAAVAAVIL